MWNSPSVMLGMFGALEGDKGRSPQGHWSTGEEGKGPKNGEYTDLLKEYGLHAKRILRAGTGLYGLVYYLALVLNWLKWQLGFNYSKPPILLERAAEVSKWVIQPAARVLEASGEYGDLVATFWNIVWIWSMWNLARNEPVLLRGEREDSVHTDGVQTNNT